MKNNKETELFFLRKRTTKKLARVAFKNSRKNKAALRSAIQKKKGKLYRKELKFIEMMVGKSARNDRRRSPSKRHLKTLPIKLPRNFSIIDEPQECLKKLREFSLLFEDSHVSGIDISEVNISHENTKNADLAAEILLAKVAKSCMDKRADSKGKHRRFEISGDYPESVNISRIIRSIGIVKELDIQGSTLEESEEKAEKRILIFKRRSDAQAETSIGSLDHKTRTTEEFVVHINNCLQQSGYELTDDAERILCEYIGEIITNAQDHSGTKHWEIFGYLDKANEEKLCEVVIFNFGHTISETFRNLPASSFARRELNKYLKTHGKGGYLKSGWNQDLLTTVFSLQGSVSSKNSQQDNTRGHGTVALIEFFQDIVERSDDSRRAKMCILSGSEHIKFDGMYRLKENEGKPIIAFNAMNDLTVSPDRRYVRSLSDVSFPGTLIAIQFVLPENATQEITS